MAGKMKKVGKHLKRIAKSMIPDLRPESSRNNSKRNGSFTAMVHSPASTSTSNTPQPTPPTTPIIAAKHKVRVVAPKEPRKKSARKANETRSEEVAIMAAGGVHCQEWLKGRFEEPVGEVVGREPGTRVSESGTVVRKV